MFLRALGKTFIAIGVLILLFLGYQLWGTGLIADRDQLNLRESLLEDWENTPPADASAVEVPLRPNLGEAVGVIRIPRIDVDWAVVEGVSVEALKKGPGHYPDTAFPGEAGNVVISAHRATYGAPFALLDRVGVGDTIELETVNGLYTYEVRETKIVQPTDIAVVAKTDDFRLTLITCNPRYGTAQRLIVVADLVDSVVRTTT
jgi:sortase A